MSALFRFYEAKMNDQDWIVKLKPHADRDDPEFDKALEAAGVEVRDTTWSLTEPLVWKRVRGSRETLVTVAKAHNWEVVSARRPSFTGKTYAGLPLALLVILCLVSAFIVSASSGWIRTIFLILATVTGLAVTWTIIVFVVLGVLVVMSHRDAPRGNRPRR
jgi:hypothetical protein